LIESTKESSRYKEINSFSEREKLSLKNEVDHLTRELQRMKHQNDRIEHLLQNERDEKENEVGRMN